MSVRSRLRTAARSVLRPFWLVVWRHMEPRIRAMGVVRNDDVWQQHLPAFLNAVSTVGAFGHELLCYRKESVAGLAALDSRLAAMNARLDGLTPLRGEIDVLVATQRSAAAHVAELSARIESVRRDILFEKIYSESGQIKPAAGPSAALKPRIVSSGKVEAARDAGLRINLGCGHIPLDGYVNVDMLALPGVDIIAEAGNVPVEAGSVQEVHSAHLLEQFPQKVLRCQLLPYWLSLLAPGGTFKAIVTDGEAMLNHVAARDYSFEQFREALFGAQDYNGDLYFNLFTPDTLKTLLDEAGFVDTEVPMKGRRSGLRYEFEIKAHRP
jgi:hypothetical protein